MKLSEALRLGEVATVPVHGSWIEVDNNGKTCGACAVGRASLVAGYVPHKHELWSDHKGEYVEDVTEIELFWNHTWPWTKTFRPSKSYENDHIVENNVLAMVSDLYEDFRMPMAMIATWIESIEPKEEACTTTLTTHNSSTCPVA
jgi:hypothetical protein